MSNFYSLKADALRGDSISFEKFKGKVVLIVNTASKCGLTPQYEGLQNLYNKYNSQGLEIIGFPCNQFGSQEPGGVESIEETCQINYGVSFQMFAKVDVNGENQHEVFSFLKTNLSNIWGSKIKWNFTKFLVDKQGNAVKRFSPITKPEKLESYIEELLKK